MMQQDHRMGHMDHEYHCWYEIPALTSIGILPQITSYNGPHPTKSAIPRWLATCPITSRLHGYYKGGAHSSAQDTEFWTTKDALQDPLSRQNHHCCLRHQIKRKQLFKLITIGVVQKKLKLVVKNAYGGPDDICRCSGTILGDRLHFEVKHILCHLDGH